jgi:hypothetical protein
MARHSCDCDVGKSRMGVHRTRLGHEVQVQSALPVGCPHLAVAVHILAQVVRHHVVWELFLRGKAAPTSISTASSDAKGTKARHLPHSTPLPSSPLFPPPPTFTLAPFWVALRVTAAPPHRDHKFSAKQHMMSAIANSFPISHPMQPYSCRPHPGDVWKRGSSGGEGKEREKANVNKQCKEGSLPCNAPLRPDTPLRLPAPHTHHPRPGTQASVASRRLGTGHSFSVAVTRDAV